MKRRRRASDSSLDLFLDAICNTFGGIMFMSILVSLLVQIRKDAIETESQLDPNMNLTAIQETQHHIEALEMERRNLESVLKELREQFPSSENQRVSAATAELSKQQGILDEMVRTQDSMSTELVDAFKEIQNLEDELQSLDENLLMTKANAETKKSELQKELDRRQQATRLPMVRNSVKGNVLLAMQYDKVYCINTYDEFGLPNGLDESQVDVQRFPFDRIRPKPEAGLDLNADRQYQSFRQLLLLHPPDEYVLTIGVCVDSFDSFEKFKRIAIDLGYEYELFPLKDEGWIAVGERTGGVLVQ